MPLTVISALGLLEPLGGHRKAFRIAKCDAKLDKRSHRNLNEKSELYFASGARLPVLQPVLKALRIERYKCL